MLSLWPFRGDSNSAESFEKTLAALQGKISKTSSQNESLRQRSLKLKVGWTLYGGFTYILALLIFFLVTGWRNFGAMEITVISGGPPLLYCVRYLLNAWYSYRTTNSQSYLESLYKQRDETIEKLKTATKYDSTQKLLEKYGGSSPGSAQKKEKANGKPKGQGRSSTTSSPKQPPEKRVFINPPATANIQRGPLGPSTSKPSAPVATEEFAPNAYDEANPRPPPAAIAAPFQSQSRPPQQPYQETQAPVGVSGGGWMDRLVTALMGEDETLPANRLALLCTSCRLVNGLAPPGIRTLEELGRWKCASCGAWNGLEPVVAPIISEPAEPAEPDKLDKLDEEQADLVEETAKVKEAKKSKGKGKKKAAKVETKKEDEDEEAGNDAQSDDEKEVKKNKGKDKKKLAKIKKEADDEEVDEDDGSD